MLHSCNFFPSADHVINFCDVDDAFLVPSEKSRDLRNCVMIFLIFFVGGDNKVLSGDELLHLLFFLSVGNGAE